jgi:amidase
MTRAPRPIALVAALLLAVAAAPPTAADVPPPVTSYAPPYDPLSRLTQMDIAAINAELAAGTLTSEQLVRFYITRIRELDDAGPQVNAVGQLYSDAFDLAKQRDAERAAGKIIGPLHGVPILIKDNIEAEGALATTAGSRALMGNVTRRDAPLVARLRAAGAIILGRTNLSEWANFRSSDSTSGWSAMWGLTRNPHALSRSACGSSSGSGAGIAASFASAAIGTETDGSIVCPAGTNGIVGFKPTLGLVSRRHIIPISTNQDTAGPMTKSVRDAALLLTAIAGSDAGDAATAEADTRRTDYVAALRPDALRGARIGVMRGQAGKDKRILANFDKALAVMAAAGAVLVEIPDLKVDEDELGQAEYAVLLADFRAEIDAYLAEKPHGVARVGPKSLAELMAFNAKEWSETRWFGQDIFEAAMKAPPVGSAEYAKSLATAKRMAGPEGIDRLLSEHKVDVLVGVTNGPAWAIDLVHGDRFAGPGASQMPAVAGYPHLTVPMSHVEGLPVGLSIIGGKWDDARVLAIGAAFERGSPGWQMLTPALRADVTDFPQSGPR